MVLFILLNFISVYILCVLNVSLIYTYRVQGSSFTFHLNVSFVLFARYRAVYLVFNKHFCSVLNAQRPRYGKNVNIFRGVFFFRLLTTWTVVLVIDKFSHGPACSLREFSSIQIDTPSLYKKANVIPLKLNIQQTKQHCVSCLATTRCGQRSKNSVHFCNIGNRLFTINQTIRRVKKKIRNLFSSKFKKRGTFCFFVTL